MYGIEGDLCAQQSEMKKAFSKRRKEQHDQSVPHAQVEGLLQHGWEVHRTMKTRTKLVKHKKEDELFEDRVWQLFYNLGFLEINKDRHLKLCFENYNKQIDVLARDENNIFVVECRSSTGNGPINARSPLEEFVGKREEIQRALEARWGRRCGRINIIVVVSSQDKREQDEEYAKARRDKNIFLWSERDIKYIESLIQQVGRSAKYQLYSVIFAGKRQKSLQKKVLALRSKMGGRFFYSFLISAKELLNYAYIHHRTLTGIVEASQAYQRMLRGGKLKEIKEFIDKDDGYFANSIIVNFSKPLAWSRKDSLGDVAVGTVTLPEFYGCAWVIDGQHRLYGVAAAQTDVVVPVLAFEDLEQKEQATLFVDINEKQKKVPADLLWDLYSDIYRDSSDEKQKFRYQIAETAKKMEGSGPLMGYIDVPSLPLNRANKLSLTTVCSTIEKYSPWEHLKHPQDETKTPENAARIINSYFNVVKSLWPEDWEKGNEGVVVTNNGFGVFMMLFYDIMSYIVYKQKRFLSGASRTKEFEELIGKEFLTHVIEHLKADPGLQRAIKTEGGRGPQSDNTKYLDLVIRDFVKDFCPPRLDKLPPAPPEPPAISKIEEKARQAEPLLRKFIVEKLKMTYGDRWWKQGVPGDLKKKGDERWLADVGRKPHLRHEEAAQNERKFDYLDLGDMKSILLYGENWEQVFEPVFIKKSDVDRRINDIKVLRDPAAHSRRLDQQDMIDGMGGLLWLSNCLGVAEVNPYI